MQEKGRIFSSEAFSRPARRLLRRAIKAGVERSVIEQIAQGALESTEARRLTGRGGGEVVNSRDLLELKDLKDRTISERRLNAPEHADTLGMQEERHGFHFGY